MLNDNIQIRSQRSNKNFKWGIIIKYESQYKKVNIGT